MTEDRYYFLLFNQQSLFTGFIYQTRQLVKKSDRNDSKKEVIIQNCTRYTPDTLDLSVDLLTMEYRNGWVVIELSINEVNTLLNKQVELEEVDPFSFELCPFARSDM